jgi:acyl-CoA synthetase (AMP-forming)/AMP-acid ligase II
MLHPVRIKFSILCHCNIYLSKFDQASAQDVIHHSIYAFFIASRSSDTLGYLHTEKATLETFVHHDDGRWIRTGDEAVFTKTGSGTSQLIIVDRIKELIKVKGFQVTPAELEAHLITHEAVVDCAVIQVLD